MKNSKLNFFFDADGVLFRYDRDAYVGEDPLWLRKNSHYFRNLEPDRRLLKVMDNLFKEIRYTGDNVYILTSLVNNGMIFNEHFHDKIVSFNKWFPYIDIDHIIISSGPKREVVEYITDNTLSDTDILIDDYNKNLLDWERSGGTSIKYCNGINNPDSFNGMRILPDTPADTILNDLLSISKRIKIRKD